MQSHTAEPSPLVFVVWYGPLTCPHQLGEPSTTGVTTSEHMPQPLVVGVPGVPLFERSLFSAVIAVNAPVPHPLLHLEKLMPPQNPVTVLLLAVMLRLLLL